MGRYLEGRLQATPVTADLAPPVRDATDRMVQASRAAEDAAGRELVARAVLDAAENEAERAIKLMNDVVFNEGGRTRESPLYRGVFVKPVSVLIQPRGAAQRDMLAWFLEHLDEFSEVPAIQQTRPRLESAQKVLNTSIDGWTVAAKAKADADLAFLFARRDFVNTYNSTYGSILQLVHTKVAADLYFPKGSRRKKKDADLEGATPVAPAGAAPSDTVPSETVPSSQPEAPTAEA